MFLHQTVAILFFILDKKKKKSKAFFGDEIESTEDE